MNQTTPTTELRDYPQFVFAAKLDRTGRAWALTYTNVAQAQKKADGLGEGWCVFKPANSRCIFVVSAVDVWN